MGYDWEKLTNTAESGRQHGVKIVTYGKAGAGKTTLIETLTETPEEDVLVANAEGGTLSISHRKVPAAPIQSFAEFEAFLDDVEVQVQAGEFPFTDLAIDSLSEIVESCLKRQKEVHPEDTWAQYRVLKERVIAILKQIRDMKGVNIYVTCEMTRESSETGGVMFQPKVPGSKVAEKIPYIFDEVFALRVEQNPESGDTERWVQTHPDAKYDAKDRSGQLDKFEPPNLHKVKQKILEG